MLTHSQKEIDDCLAYIDSQDHLPPAMVSIWVYVLTNK